MTASQALWDTPSTCLYACLCAHGLAPPGTTTRLPSTARCVRRLHTASTDLQPRLALEDAGVGVHATRLAGGGGKMHTHAWPRSNLRVNMCVQTCV